jgi:hypothetical protein
VLAKEDGMQRERFTKVVEEVLDSLRLHSI